MLAPWLAKQLTPTKLRSIVTGQFLAQTDPVDFVLNAIDVSLDDLRRHYAEYYENDPKRTLATTKDLGEWGPPSLYLADEITAANFRQWMSTDLTPELDHPSGVDYLLRLWFAVVDVDETLKIGYLEPGY